MITVFVSIESLKQFSRIERRSAKTACSKSNSLYNISKNCCQVIKCGPKHSNSKANTTSKLKITSNFKGIFLSKVSGHVKTQWFIKWFDLHIQIHFHKNLFTFRRNFFTNSDSSSVFNYQPVQASLKKHHWKSSYFTTGQNNTLVNLARWCVQEMYEPKILCSVRDPLQWLPSEFELN